MPDSLLGFQLALQAGEAQSQTTVCEQITSAPSQIVFGSLPGGAHPSPYTLIHRYMQESRSKEGKETEEDTEMGNQAQ